jgi:hypothetical protein
VLTPTTPANQIAQGQGYWARFPQTTDLVVPGTDLGVGTSAFAIPLGAGWNMVGDPTAHSVPLSQLTVGTEPFQTSALVSPAVWEYSPSTNTYTSVSELDPWMGCWIFANQPCTLDVPEP